MNTRHLFRVKYYSTPYYSFNSFRYLSKLHAAVSNDSIKNFREKKVRRVERQGNVYVKTPEIANSIASYIAKEWNGGYLLEANAGPGILSHSLLQKGIKHLRVFEKNDEFLPALEVISADYPSLEIVLQDLTMIPSFEFKKNSDPSNYVKEYFDNLFKDIPVCSWEEDTAFQVFSFIANKRSHKFLRYLLVALPNQATLFSFGRCDFFLLISETEFLCMNAQPKTNFSMYRWSTVLYNLFFEIKCLQKFATDSENFYFCNPEWSKKKKRTPYFYLMKLTPKRDLFKHPMTPEKLLQLFFFVRSNLVKRSDLVIESIENWMPFCGPRLIKEGLNVFVKFGDLSPAEILKLFNCIASWPEYKNCYSEALASKFNKKKLTDDDDDDDDGGIE